MNAVAVDYLTDPRDRVILGQTPVLMQPLFGQLPPLEPHKHRFVAARSGIFLQCSTPTLRVCVRVSRTLFDLPYGDLDERVELVGGRLPRHLYDSMRDRAVAACPSEWACLVLWDAERSAYQIVEPDVVSASAGHIRFRNDQYDPDTLVLDLHTHGRLDAYFSQTDDASDCEGGCYLATVLGHCESVDSITATTRIVVNGLFYPVKWSPWEDK